MKQLSKTTIQYNPPVSPVCDRDGTELQVGDKVWYPALTDSNDPATATIAVIMESDWPTMIQSDGVLVSQPMENKLLLFVEFNDGSRDWCLVKPGDVLFSFRRGTIKEISRFSGRQTLAYSPAGYEGDYLSAFPEIDGMKCTGWCEDDLFEKCEAAFEVLAKITSGDFRADEAETLAGRFFKECNENPYSYYDPDQRETQD